jgi:hypothetical protein
MRIGAAKMSGAKTTIGGAAEIMEPKITKVPARPDQQ